MGSGGTIKGVMELVIGFIRSDLYRGKFFSKIFSPIYRFRFRRNYHVLHATDRRRKKFNRVMGWTIEAHGLCVTDASG